MPKSPLLALFPLAAVLCCSAQAPSGPTRHESAHLTFVDVAGLPAATPALAASVEVSLIRVLTDLEATSLPRVTVTFHATHEDLAEAVRSVAGPIPSWASALATARDQVHMLRPDLATAAAVSSTATVVTHELAHCASLQVNRTIANNPRWLWETVALYEAGQRADVRNLPFMQGDAPPSLLALNAIEDQRIYQLGFSLGDFIVRRWGASKLIALIKSNGDLEATLGITRSDFEAGWLAFVRTAP